MTTVSSLVGLICCYIVVLEHGMVHAIPRKLTVSVPPLQFFGQPYSVPSELDTNKIVFPRGGGGRFGNAGNSNNIEDELPIMVLPPTLHNLWSLNPLTKVPRRWLAFFRTHSPQIPQRFRGMMSSKQTKYQVIGILVGSVVAVLCDCIMKQRKEKQLEYLIWDAKELVPEVWDTVEQLLNETTLTDQEVTYTTRSIKGLKNRVDLQDLLLAKVNKAKALQVAGIYQKHFPDQWKKLVTSNNSNNNIMTTLAKRQRLLGKLTRNISRHKFTALLRPDYAFGIGRNGVDLSNKNPSNNGMVDTMLLQQVTEDLMTFVPHDYPETWIYFTSKLYPGQTLWDRHDLVLKMVKNVQMQKSKDRMDDGTTNMKSSSSTTWGSKNSHRTQSGERNFEVVDTTSGRDVQHSSSSSSSSQVSSN